MRLLLAGGFDRCGRQRITDVRVWQRMRTRARERAHDGAGRVCVCKGGGAMSEPASACGMYVRALRAHCRLNDRSCVCAHCVQAALMGVVSSAVAALDTNRGIAEVASAGLGFLQNLAMAPENKVTLVMVQCCGWEVGSRSLHVCMLVCAYGIVKGCAALLLCVQVPLMDVVSCAMEAMDAHRGVAEVVQCGLAFLHNLALAPEHQVTPVMMQCCGREWVCWRLVNVQVGAYFWSFLACVVRCFVRIESRWR
jgi:hypothetical protein